MTIPEPAREFVKTVLVLGASYGGVRAAQVLAAGLPDTVRILVIDRNSHANHLYVLPRYAVLAGHEHKAFIPYTNIFRRPVTPSRVFLHARVVSLARNSATLSRAFPEHGIPSSTIHFDYAIYALGARLPAPLDLWQPEFETDMITSGSKKQGIEWLKTRQVKLKHASSVLVVGGGALGIQFASDIATVYPSKDVTLLHSRARLLPKFNPSMHAEIMASLASLGVRVILSERLETACTFPSHTADIVSAKGDGVMYTTSGRKIAADLVLLCTGQIANTELLASAAPDAIDPISKEAHVLRTLQLAPLSDHQTNLSTALEGLEVSEVETRLDTDEKFDRRSLPLPTSYPHIFVIGDSADAFGAIKAGHNAYYQGEVAARNVVRLIKTNWKSGGEQAPWIIREQDPVASDKAADTDLALELYTPGPPAIKVTLGLTRSVSQVDGSISTSEAGVDDLEAPRMWDLFAVDTADMSV